MTKDFRAIAGWIALGVMGCNVAAADSRMEAGAPNLTEDIELVATTAEIELDAAQFEAMREADLEAEQIEDSGADLPDNDAALELEPVDYRIARRLKTVYAQPRSSAPIRGRVPTSRAFAIFGYVDGPGCEERWADVGNAGFVCLDNTRAAGDKRPALEPPMKGHKGLTPFFYAQTKKGQTAPRWSSLKAYGRGEQPRDHLVKGTDYAFTSRMLRKGEILLVDARGFVIREKDVKRFRPSRFSGRKLAEAPVPEHKQLAWVVAWPKAVAYAEPNPEADALGPVDYHTELHVDDSAVENNFGKWRHTEDGGWVREKDLRIWDVPADRPDGVGDGELWVDVNLEQQILTAMVGEEPVFVTMISSGFKGPTPKGVFRIRNKQAVGAMASSPGESDFYSVEAVPFVQYFRGSIALHGAYWHNYFGKPISHGCVNLSPRDSQYVFSLTSPEAPAGWVHAYETESEQGTTVRVRRGDRPVDDRRKPVKPVFGA